MSATALARLRAAGVKVTREGSDLRLSRQRPPRDPVTGKLRNTLTEKHRQLAVENKALILGYLEEASAAARPVTACPACGCDHAPGLDRTCPLCGWVWMPRPAASNPKEGV